MTNTTTAAAKTAAAAAAPIANACLCSTFAVITGHLTLGNGQPDTTEETTGCDAVTAREFAPGHDAKLKALLIRAGVDGLEVRQGSITSSAQKAASQFAFAWMVEKGIERGRAKAAARAEKKAAKADRPRTGRATRKVAQAPAASTREHIVAAIAATETAEIPAEAAPAVDSVQIKIGRWFYAATIDASGDAHYTNGKGVAAVAAKGIYKLA